MDPRCYPDIMDANGFVFQNFRHEACKDLATMPLVFGPGVKFSTTITVVSDQVVLNKPAANPPPVRHADPVGVAKAFRISANLLILAIRARKGFLASELFL